MANANEMVLRLEDFNGHVGKCAEGFEGIHEGYGIGKRNVEGRMLLDFCVQKDLCVANTWYKKRDERKVTYSSGRNDTDTHFVLLEKEKRKYLRQGWATSLVDGPYVGRRSPSRAGLLDGSSSISSTTTIVRAALIRKAKKGSHVLRCPVLHQKNAKKGVHVLRCPVFHRKYR